MHHGLANISQSHTVGSSHILNLAHPGFLFVPSPLSGMTFCYSLSELPLFYYKLSVLMSLVLRGFSQVPAHQSALQSDKMTLFVFVFNVCYSPNPIGFTIHRGQVIPSLLANISLSGTSRPSINVCWRAVLFKLFPAGLTYQTQVRN